MRPTLRAVVAAMIGLVAAASAAEAQQAGKVWRVGILGGTAGPQSPRWAPFLEGLRALGYVEGQNIALEWRLSGGKAERFPDLAAELARLNVDVIVAIDNPATAAGQKATRTIPIVMVLAMDPVGTGFAKALARPGGKHHRAKRPGHRAPRQSAATSQGSRAHRLSSRCPLGPY